MVDGNKIDAALDLFRIVAVKGAANRESGQLVLKLNMSQGTVCDVEITKTKKIKGGSLS